MKKVNIPLSPRHLFFSFFFSLFSVLSFGCSRVPGQLLIMEANYYLSRGMYSQSIASYLKALDYEEIAPYAEYGLGSVYFTLGEEQAALHRFGEARARLETLPPAGSRELRYRINYNTGVVLFSGGDFSAAADSFREALRVDGGKLEAKRNLELSLLSRARESLSGGGKGGTQAGGESRAVLLEYVRQKELNHWASREWPAEEDTEGPDY